jgi:hypothetical protein
MKSVEGLIVEAFKALPHVSVTGQGLCSQGLLWFFSVVSLSCNIKMCMQYRQRDWAVHDTNQLILSVRLQLDSLLSSSPPVPFAFLIGEASKFSAVLSRPTYMVLLLFLITLWLWQYWRSPRRLDFHTPLSSLLNGKDSSPLVIGIGFPS